ncbi:MAG: CBS domain-containing protein [Alphaproteobacteria bacterium]|nr:CBS domain-containing protein [Rhodospirillales bacterium]MCW9045255.1 CBS domain-containing protein [Alphaproteobacteria bacterium]
MARKIIPDVVNKQELSNLTPKDTVRAAAQLMGQKHIAAVLVVEDDKLVGIITERDLTTKVLAKNVDPDTTMITDIMTPSPDTLAPSDRPSNALELMSVRGYRHLPVTEDGKPVGIVSIRDLYAIVKDGLEQDVKDRDAFIFGETYGSSHK